MIEVFLIFAHRPVNLWAGASADGSW